MAALSGETRNEIKTLEPQVDSPGACWALIFNEGTTKVSQKTTFSYRMSDEVFLEIGFYIKALATGIALELPLEIERNLQVNKLKKSKC